MRVFQNSPANMIAMDDLAHTQRKRLAAARLRPLVLSATHPSRQLIPHGNSSRSADESFSQSGDRGVFDYRMASRQVDSTSEPRRRPAAAPGRKCARPS